MKVNAMETPSSIMERQKALKDMEPVTVSRGELRDMIASLYIARDGMKVEQARIHAEVAVDCMINNSKMAK
jgi:hypothetical protein